jgi:glycerophosphoryl diester phosphodiesterase
MTCDWTLWAHRGASAEAPENTLAAFRLAERQGADGLEFDIQLSADGVPVVIHDETLERTTDGVGKVEQRPLAALLKLDAGSWFSADFQGEPLVALETVLAWAGNRLLLNIEVKNPRADRPLLRVLEAFPGARVVVSSFDHALLERLHAARPDLPLGFLNDSRLWRRALTRANRNGALSFHPGRTRVSRALLQACRSQGVEVHVWTVDDPAEAWRLKRMGVAGIFTNQPARLRAAGL